MADDLEQPGSGEPGDVGPTDDANPAGNASTGSASTGNGEYGVDQMRYMTDLEHVRERSGMYIGDTGTRGLHHLVYEAVDNSIDEAMAGYAKHIHVTI